MEKIKLRQSPVILDKLTHTYWLGDLMLQGVTSTLIPRVFPNTYSGVSEDVLEHKAKLGTNGHQAIENSINGVPVEGMYQQIVDTFNRLFAQQHITPVAAEYIVSDETTYASPVDIVGINESNEMCIIDTKFTHKLMEDHVQYQTSIYKKFFEMQNPGIEVRHLYVLWIKIDEFYNVLDSALKELKPIAPEVIDNLIECDLNDIPFDVTQTFGNLPQKVADVEEYMRKLAYEIEAKQNEYNSIKEGLIKLMEEFDVKSYTSEHIRLTRVVPKPKEIFDTKKFKADNPELAKEYIKTTIAKPSIRITFK